MRIIDKNQILIPLADLMESKKVVILGYTADFNFCECCGKDNLKGTIKMEITREYSGVDIVHYGTTCAQNVNKYDTLQAAQEAIRDIKSVVNKRMNIERKYFGCVYLMLAYYKLGYDKKENGGATDLVVANIQQVVNKAISQDIKPDYSSYPQLLEMYKEVKQLSLL